jgi:PhzF family phenazine biosynthesis protein
MSVPIYTVDAFTERAFAGNPAGVCLLDEPRDDRWMQDVAREMNLSETAFLTPQPDGFDLRWFTPAVEVDLCGHATLASAHVLWESGTLGGRAAARFHTKSGVLVAERAGEWIEMDFPAKPVERAEAPAGLAAALGVEPRFVGRNAFDYLVEVEPGVVPKASPDLARLAQVEARGVILTSRGGAGDADFVSRFFAPRAGVPEDPVTGSAHCALAPYWGARLGKTEMVGRQLSARGGVVKVRLAGDRVMLVGQAVTVLRGVLV